MTEQKEKFCNLCGESCRPSGVNRWGSWNSEDNYGLLDAKVVGEYYSHYLLDMNQYTFSFCECCLRKLFIQCKIKPLILDIIDGDEFTWELDQETWEYRMWEDSGGFHQAFLNKKCNQKKDCPNKAVYTVIINEDIFSEEACCEEHKIRWKNTINARFVPFISDVLKAFL